MIDFRIYRAAFLPALAVIVGILFSLESPPEPMRTGEAVPSLEPGTLAELATAIVELAPERPAGSAGDERVADLVAERFGEVTTGELGEQSFEASVGGETIEARNVVLTLPGQSERTIAILAARDAREGPGATTSAAATAMLLHLARELGRTQRRLTYVLASTSATAAGAAGARELLRIPQAAAAETALVIARPGARHPARPLVLGTSTGPREASLELEVAVEAIAASQTRLEPELRSGLAGLARLALPTGLGQQAVLLEASVDSVALGGPERPPAVSADGLSALSAERLDEFMRAALISLQTLEQADGSLGDGPAAKIVLGDNVIGGGALALLALMLLLPAAVASANALLICSRRGESPAAAAILVGSVAALAITGLLALQAVALVGLVPSPPFPFDPSAVDPGVGPVIGSLIVVGVLVALTWRGLGAVASIRASATARCGAAGGLGVAGVFVVWAADPYLALVLAAVPHAPLVALAVTGPGAARLTAAGLASAAALLPISIVVAQTAAALDLGGRSAWFFFLLVTSGQLGFVAAVGLALCAAALAGAFMTAAVAAGRSGPDRPAGRIASAEIVDGTRYE